MSPRPAVPKCGVACTPCDAETRCSRSACSPAAWPGLPVPNRHVNYLDESISLYTRLFGTGPAKVRPGYANFAIADPPLSSS
jgi:hypothetical protein